MIDIDSLITKIERLLAQGTPESLTYAALECRLAIEKVCYERLQFAHDYISHDDIKRYQPRHVVNTLMNEVDGLIGSSFTLSMGTEPSKIDPSESLLPEDFEDTEWIEIGTQSALNPKRLDALWHALSKAALHAHVPEHSADPISDYGDPDLVRKKVGETLEELRRIAARSLLTSGIGPTVSFRCPCGRTNERRKSVLAPGKVVHCVGHDCKESFIVSMGDEDVIFTRRVVDSRCECGKAIAFAAGYADDLKRDQFIGHRCEECGNEVRFAWRFGRLLAKTG
ncbi:hypothetical protein [Bradyrhizobium diazoefficiens]|uniref:Uncharacterized protein n=1 Tax=Bradyrhizobium diazoefficiens TaxID=1355477 RepID=A0A809Y7E8_9BRAD|nr:hypothetical protein [Bradyrhizobium diazoefficiens]BCA00041.1 hypothetical protein H12S4_09450 [Bradyrhizobium diazoefficiens]BCA17723.1 hypothetical protein BDHH15_09380 [Bradyrhizobium diazoefficiens]BCE35907.1 hypothetical protein XF3B_09380 [Bradyrhizobium diazoefficiens]BCE79511.1 hypothetical protein XF9B_09320 [Bradyrhizobium diazoefficiens]BCE96911.1 hypothetical protein XF11B_09320 [Bradyrhizobium diazoefficiens]